MIVAFYFNLENMIIGQTQQKKKQWPSLQVPYKSLKVQLVTEGLSFPTSMEFIDNNNILVLQKNDGTVHLVSNGILQKKPVLKVQVETNGERGLLGITHSGKDIVFLYFTESDHDKPLRNKIYRYHWNGTNLVNHTLILDLPTAPGPYHQGGKLKIGADNYLYAVIGDLTAPDGLLQNNKDGKKPNDTSVILRVNPDNGSSVNNNPFYNNSNNYNDKDNVKNLLSRYYAYGIRNSFGLAIDPITNMLWDTENGPSEYDEVNLVRPGFNSGWETVMGPISLSGGNEDELVNFPGSHYADPLFSWKITPAITDIEFLHSSKLGDKYTNNIFVGDNNNGNVYYFEVNEDRTGLKFDASQTGLTDLVVDDEEELSAIIFGSGFGSITDIATDPDGFLYILSFDDGVIYKISPLSNNQIAASVGS